jgi:hypothetical protein
MSQTMASEEQLVRVRVWFGRMPIVDHTADSEVGTAYANAMSRRYAGLTVTIDPLTEPRAGAER